jgi:ferric-dicitrate binding protein FerR (iron transport regulator)
MKSDELDRLIQSLFDGTLEMADREMLDRLLLESSAARERYRSASALHAALARRAGCEIQDTVISSIKPRKSAIRRLSAIAAVLVISGLASFFLLKPSPRAMIVRATGTESLISGQSLPVHTQIDLARGIVELEFPSGAEVMLEGPCRFRLDQAETLTVTHGRMSVHAPPGAQGFRVDTPGGRFIDLGTRFGLAVGSDGTNPVVLTEVYEGEVEVQSAPGKTRLTKGESRALVQEQSGSQLLNALDAEPIRVPNLAIQSPSAKEAGENLALGKPVSSPGYCIRPHGSVFPPENLTDGRLDDTGVPGDWSFWLAPDGENGEFTVDLLAATRVSRIALQNTCNRRIDDRGTESFIVLTSTDNVHYTPACEGVLPRIDPSSAGSFPFHDFTFLPVEARYVKVVVTRHYRSPRRPDDHPNQGGGLNEIRIFAE